jgi:SAM-dependent methyltransferase
MSTTSLPFPPLALRRLVSPLVDESSYDNPTGDYILGPLAIGPLAPGQAYERVLDFGCGPGRDARRLLLQRNRPNSYVGVDINREMIQWCQENLSSHGFNFVHHDVWSPTYGLDNSRNRYLPLTPLGSNFSLIHANSVFTHLHQDQTEFYLRELSSMLAPTGIIHATWFFFNKKWFPMMDDTQNTIFVSEHDSTQAVYYDWHYFRTLTRSLGLRIAQVKWTKVLGFHNIVILAKSDQFPEIGREIEPPRNVIGFSRVESSYLLPQHKNDKTGVSATNDEVRAQQMAIDLQALQAELERLLVEQRFQAERIVSLAAERDQLTQQHAAIRSSNEQTVSMLRARLEEGAAEKAVLQSKYEGGQAENQALVADNRALVADNRALKEKVNARDARLLALEARLNATTMKLERSLDKLRKILGSRGWKALSVYYRCRKALSRLLPKFLRDQYMEYLIGRSGLFDASWYLSQYPDVHSAGIAPLKHYLRYGAAEGRDPNPYFDTDWYLSHYPDVAAAGINPLRHYLRHGGIEQRDPSPRFDTREYLRMHPEVARAKLNPLAHFLKARV